MQASVAVLPAAATTTTPALVRACTASLMDTDTTAVPSDRWAIARRDGAAAAAFNTHVSPLTTQELKPEPSHPKTRTLMIVAFW